MNLFESFTDETEKIAISREAIVAAMRSRQFRLDQIAERAAKLPKGSVAREALEEKGRKLAIRSAEQSRSIEGNLQGRIKSIADNADVPRQEALRLQMNSRGGTGVGVLGDLGGLNEPRNVIESKGTGEAIKRLKANSAERRQTLGLKGSTYRPPVRGDKALDEVAKGGKDLEAVRAARPFREFKGYDEATYGASGSSRTPIAPGTRRPVVSGSVRMEELYQKRYAPNRERLQMREPVNKRGIPSHSYIGQPRLVGGGYKQTGSRYWSGGGVLTPGRRSLLTSPSSGASKLPSSFRGKAYVPKTKAASFEGTTARSFYDELEKISAKKGFLHRRAASIRKKVHGLQDLGHREVERVLVGAADTAGKTVGRFGRAVSHGLHPEMIPRGGKGRKVALPATPEEIGQAVRGGLRGVAPEVVPEVGEITLKGPLGILAKSIEHTPRGAVKKTPKRRTGFFSKKPSPAEILSEGLKKTSAVSATGTAGALTSRLAKIKKLRETDPRAAEKLRIKTEKQLARISSGASDLASKRKSWGPDSSGVTPSERLRAVADVIGSRTGVGTGLKHVKAKGKKQRFDATNVTSDAWGRGGDKGKNREFVSGVGDHVHAVANPTKKSFGRGGMFTKWQPAGAGLLRSPYKRL